MAQPCVFKVDAPENHYLPLAGVAPKDVPRQGNAGHQHTGTGLAPMNSDAAVTNSWKTDALLPIGFHAKVRTGGL